MNTFLAQYRLRLKHFWMLLLVVIIVIATIPSPQPAAAVTWSVPNFISETFIGSDPRLVKVTAMAWMPPSDTGFVLLALKQGRVRVYDQVNHTILSSSFISIVNEVNDISDRGLLGIAVDPDFPTRPYVYLLYTYDPQNLPCATVEEFDCPDGAGARVARLMRVEADPLAIPPYSKAKTDPATRKILLGTNSTLANIRAVDMNSIDHPPPNTTPPSCDVGGVPVQDCLPIDSRSHTIGTVMFGPDKKLYVSNGDGSEYGFADPKALRVQNIDSLSGKVLRIDPDTGEGLADNPFYNGNPDSNRSKVWMYGLRNPFRITIHPITGEVYAGDVGWNVWEEINVGKGKNFGWPCYEGIGRQPAYENDIRTAATCAALYAQPNGGAQAPLYTYEQVNNNGAAMAGAFYFGTNYPSAYNGALFVGDYALDRTEYMKFDNAGIPTVYPFAEDMSDRSAATSFAKSIVQMTAGPQGDLYYVVFDNKSSLAYNEIRRIRYTGGDAPPIAELQATPTNGASPLTVAFDGSASFDPEGGALTYLWDFGDGNTSTQAVVSHTYTNMINYTVRLTVSDPQNQTSTKTQVISVGNTPPSVTLSMPTDNTYFNVRDHINYSGTASDPQDGDLTGSIQWEGILHHDDHTHPMFEVQGASGSFATEDHADAMWIELCASITDSGGLVDRECVDLLPNKVNYTFTSIPPGMTVIYEGIAHSTPFTVQTNAGATQQVSTPQTQNGYNFVRWENNSTSSNRSLLIGSTDTTVTAYFQQQPNTVNYSFVTEPPGLSIVYEGVRRITPFSAAVQEGDTKQISLPDPQNGYSFLRWDDKSTNPSRILTIGATAKTITAYFTEQQTQQVTYTFTSEPAGKIIILGTTPRVTPFSVAVDVGSTQHISIAEVQNGWKFLRWEDGTTTLNRDFSVNTTPQTITAFFEELPPPEWKVFLTVISQ